MPHGQIFAILYIMKILLINSDLAKNRGDRAIAEGIISLLKSRYESVEITGHSEQPERDKLWYGIDFLDMSFQSLNPFDFLRLARAARNSDIVFWGGGEILKDYTNKAALWYWVLKISLLARFNPNIYGAYQGIGPTKANTSRSLIVRVVKRTKKFIVRDDESRQKLIDWGAPASAIISSSDPAVLPQPDPIDDALAQKLYRTTAIDQSFTDNFICIGPRDWFHYKPGGLIPFKYKKKLRALLGKPATMTSPDHATYLDNLAELIKSLLATYDCNILLTPMHMEESDAELCQLLRDKSGDLQRVRVLDNDEFSPSELRSVIGSARAMIGFRLHSNIIGISAGVPSMNIYYVDKGRVFFDQINQQQYAQPIENTLASDFVQSSLAQFAQLYQNRSLIHEHITASTELLRQNVRTALYEALPETPEEHRL